ncbi:uncharacterized protein LOC122057733 [Macadamia integrifolia]|uniref:uncharacterized protein LOC122057733 n=1 Tax=Macadamia integrifolia TaxID=60698 RepID=UPI001C52E477|nr:uncharacterized protein LOC122057733 [Macadamia integrifolia]
MGLSSRFFFSIRWRLSSPIVFLCFSLLCFSSFTAAETVYEVLESYDFPVGLLPKGVSSYDLDTSTGKFSVYLNETCTFTIDSYELKYKSTITGYITTDKLSELKGISVKVLFFWLSIVEVTRSDDELDFSVGIASADFPVANFDESPECGCGFDCDDAQIHGESEWDLLSLPLKMFT